MGDNRCKKTCKNVAKKRHAVSGWLARRKKKSVGRHFIGRHTWPRVTNNEAPMGIHSASSLPLVDVMATWPRGEVALCVNRFCHLWLKGSLFFFAWNGCFLQSLNDCMMAFCFFPSSPQYNRSSLSRTHWEWTEYFMKAHEGSLLWLNTHQIRSLENGRQRFKNLINLL